VIVLSDLHMGPGDGRDDFCADVPLVGRLRRWHSQGKEIVLAGDTFELWQATIAEVEAAHPRACQAIEDYVDWIVAGNHDSVPRLCGKPVIDAYHTKAGTLVVHGHQHDRFNSGRLQWVGRTGAWLAGKAELLHPDADAWLLALGNRVRFGGRYGNPDRYRRIARRIVRDHPHVRRVVFGHTHVPHRFDGIYANAGTWTGTNRHFVEVE